MSDEMTWAYCIRCGRPLTSPTSQRDGFGLECYARLSRDERSRLLRGAVAMREVATELRYGDRLVGLDRWVVPALHRWRLLRVH